MLQEADAAIATTRGSAFAGETIPVKLFDYLAAGAPSWRPCGATRLR